MKRIPVLLISAALASACATPVTMLKNAQTGQIARCGGGAAGSLAGGLIGHNIEKDSDAQCVRDYEAKGFKKS